MNHLREPRTSAEVEALALLREALVSLVYARRCPTAHDHHVGRCIRRLRAVIALLE
jgi:hypothetical protein